MSLLRAAATVSSFTLLSRITGLARDIIIARAFGAGALTDAFWVAFRIPNLLRRLFAEGAFAQAFVPILGEVKNQHESEAVRVLLDRVAITLFLVLSLHYLGNFYILHVNVMSLSLNGNILCLLHNSLLLLSQ
jgi:putative peptidoglycan lipid II flippase